MHNPFSINKVKTPLGEKYMDFLQTLEYLSETLTPQEQQYLDANPNKKSEIIAKKKMLKNPKDVNKYDVDMKTGKIIPKSSITQTMDKNIANKIR